MIKKIAIIYHSARGHTEYLARQIATGARTVENVDVHLVLAESMAVHPEDLLAYDAFIFGSPTYLGGVSAPFKSFMDATGGLWRVQALKDRFAAGFTVSSLPAGDKQSTLSSMFTFCMQHGMIWIGNPILPEQHAGALYEEAANRLGSWSGFMAQAGHGSEADAFVPGDVKTAHMFGSHFARSVRRYLPQIDVAVCKD